MVPIGVLMLHRGESLAMPPLTFRSGQPNVPKFVCRSGNRKHLASTPRSAAEPQPLDRRCHNHSHNNDNNNSDTSSLCSHHHPPPHAARLCRHAGKQASRARYVCFQRNPPPNAPHSHSFSHSTLTLTNKSTQVPCPQASHFECSPQLRHFAPAGN